MNNLTPSFPLLLYCNREMGKEPLSHQFWWLGKQGGREGVVILSSPDIQHTPEPIPSDSDKAPMTASLFGKPTTFYLRLV